MDKETAEERETQGKGVRGEERKNGRRGIEKRREVRQGLGLGWH